MIKVELTGAARDYIRQNNTDAITVEIMTLHYYGVINEAVVTLGKPISPEDNDLVTVDGINVYVYKGAETEPGGIKISVKDNPDEPNRLQVTGLIYDKFN
ncbi:MAG: CC/Se motif family (seleno)protein [Pelotomaculum sp.]|jgi:hypothetical protein